MRKIEIGSVNGQVADTINNHGPIYFGGRPPAPPTKVDYLELAKQQLPQVVWGQLDQIVQSSDVTEKELWLACKKKALGCKHGKLVRKFVWVDYAVGSYGMFLILCMLSLCFWAMVTSDISKQSWQQQTLVSVYLLINTGLAFAVMSLFFLPHRTGRLAMVALGAESGRK